MSVIWYVAVLLIVYLIIWYSYKQMLKWRDNDVEWLKYALFFGCE